ncbi:MAG: thioredoxin family protein [Ignavibacteria bacterium]|nr:thioredoxin family protein [Ignavibacteria bacterium]
MKKLILFLILTFGISFAQQQNKMMLDEKSGKQMLIGICDRTAFADTNYSWWFSAEYDNYKPDSVVVAKIKTIEPTYKIIIVMASWCGDSKREVPRFYKIMDAAGYDYKNYELVCVDRDKKCEEGEVDKLDIKFVPTFIFSKNDVELGRIIEMPKGKLEEDILEIVSK